MTLTIKPESRTEFLAALRAVLVPARSEPGCVCLYANESVDEPGKFVLHERWRDMDEYVNEVLQRDYFQQYLNLSENAYAAPRVVVMLNPIEPLDQ
ncbi:putative quinol monooxygenase [Nocardia sp. NPDC060256]|uniref:putative quinol monooxygenase n=1 Tax=unclassified Nocardia TaxID=2637762 RepID=UPI003667F15D